ncbi:MAG: cytochrome c3 family protein [Draconibacterium sp.]
MKKINTNFLLFSRFTSPKGLNSLLSNYSIFLLLLLFISNPVVYGQTNDDCLSCHNDPELSKMRAGKKISLYVKPDALNKSVHSSLECTFCHSEAAVTDFPHPENMTPVNCGDCHDGAMTEFMEGIHGAAYKRNDHNAPTCKECHGSHQILTRKDPQSRTYKMNIPVLCGQCHREGAPVSRGYNVSQHNILENYSQGTHGIGLYEKGLTVTATCNDCHGNHKILPHTNLNSSVSRKNIAATCMTCHARIEDVHVKIINKTLWEKSPGAIPACTDCHPPHKVELRNVLDNITDRTCLVCHEKDNVHKMVDGKQVSLKVDVVPIASSVHKSITCVKCHSDITPNITRPCETAEKVDCSSCHAEVADIYASSGHGQAYDRKMENAPYCTECHGTHLVKSKNDETSPVFRSAVPALCGKCHQNNGKALIGTELNEKDALHDYSTSVHGLSLKEKGLLSTAICTDCHTTHLNLKQADERSSVHPNNLAATCGKCHKGIYDQFMDSDHGYKAGQTDLKLPTCETCHTAHNIANVKSDRFTSQITVQCGKCHEQLAETYLETYHGKAHQLGHSQAASCSDCHGAHNIYKMDNPKSTIGPRNIVKTCQKCHTDANMKFTGYLTHATHYNKEEFPWLYYTFWAMTSLLLSVFLIFGLHTLLWLPRSIGHMIKKREHPKIEGRQVYIRRFSKTQRITHIFVIVSFITLALTGMILKFSYMDWAKLMAKLIGGAQVAGVLHRIAAVMTFGYFIYHVISLFKLKKSKGLKLKNFIFGNNTLMFNKQDLKDFWASIRWFIGIGPRPDYGRWTYWEKFDYFAVFWGVVVIGSTGLMLWFPEIFTKFLPGWLINVAQIIHSDEALLAVVFIFTIHFFNTHLRPESFPMDTVIFTGHVPLEEYKHDRPRDYERLVKSGKLEKYTIETEFSPTKMKLIKIFGYLALGVGTILAVLIIYSLLFH